MIDTATPQTASFGGFKNLPIVGTGAPIARPTPAPAPKEISAEVRSLKETAKFFRVSEPTVRSWIDDGCPVVERGSNGVSYQLNVVAVHEWREGRAAAEAQAEAELAEKTRQLQLELLGGESAGGEFEGLSPAQARQAMEAERLRDELARSRREFVNASGTAIGLVTIGGALRDRITSIPEILARQAGLDEVQVEQAAMVIEEILEDLADLVEEKCNELEGGADDMAA